MLDVSRILSVRAVAWEDVTFGYAHDRALRPTLRWRILGVGSGAG